MGFAERKAAELKQAATHTHAARQWAIERAQAARQGIPTLWEELGKATKREVEQFAKLMPAAHSLHYLLGSPTHFSVVSENFPIIKMNVYLAPEGHVQADLTIFRSSVLSAPEPIMQRFLFDADDNLKPCFYSDDGVQLHPQLVAEEILEPVFSAFEPR